MSRPLERLIASPGVKVWEDEDGRWWREDPVGLWRWSGSGKHWTLAQMARPRINS